MNNEFFKNCFSGKSMLVRYSKWWLTALLIFIPFQSTAANSVANISRDLSYLIEYLDKLTILVLLPISLIKIYINKEYPSRLYILMGIPVLIFTISGFISGLLNGNSILVTALGTFEYIEYIAVIFIYAAFFDRIKDFKFIFSVLVKASLFLVTIAFVQEVWAVTSRYIFEKEIYDISSWRLGIYRPKSLLSSTNIFGLYIFLILAIYLNTTLRANKLVSIFLMTGVLLSMTKLVFAGLLLLCLAQIFRGKKSFMFLLVPVLILLLTLLVVQYMAVDDYSILGSQKKQWFFVKDEYQVAVKETAIDIWKDHIIVGAGPGMYGGKVSLLYKSGIYSNYLLSNDVMFHLRRVGDMNQLWFQVLAEMGLAGFISYTLFFIALLIVLLILRIWATSYDSGRLFVGLLIITMIIIVFSLYTGLKSTPLVFTFYAITGLAIGSEKEKYH
jgi:hypothetical protein